MDINVIINADCIKIPKNAINVVGYDNFYHNLLVTCGFNQDYPPIAKLFTQLENLTGNWFVASPIYWRASNNNAQIILTDRNLLSSIEKSRLWFNVLVDFLEPLGIKTHYDKNDNWLIKSDDNIKIRPAHSIVKKPIMLFMQELTEFWRRIFTESQMYLANHPLNKSDNYPINGFWFWGDNLSNIATLKTNNKIYCTKNTHNIAEILSNDINEFDFKNFKFLKNIRSQKSVNIIIAADDTEISNIELLQQKLNNYHVNWYWNDKAYTSKSLGILSRIWSKKC